MSLSSLVATLGYYPIAGISPAPSQVGVLYKRVEEDVSRPRIEVKKVTSEDFESGINVAIITIKSV